MSGESVAPGPAGSSRDSSGASLASAPGNLDSRGSNCHGPCNDAKTGLPAEFVAWQAAQQARWWRALDGAWKDRAKRRNGALKRRASDVTVNGLTTHYRAGGRRVPGHRYRGGVVIQQTRRPLPGWWESRAAAMEVPLQARVRACGERSATVVCGCLETVCDGRTGEVFRRPVHRRVPMACGLRCLCPTCQRRAAHRIRRRLGDSLAAHAKAAASRWAAAVAARPELRWRHVAVMALVEGVRVFRCIRASTRRTMKLVTLTVRHSGDLPADRERLRAAAQRLRQWLHKQLSEDEHQRAIYARPGQYPYALAWEVTPGRDGLGHVHCHVAALLPWLDWSRIQAEWKRAICDDGAHLDIQASPKKPDRRGRARPLSASEAAHYLAKYLGKGVEIGAWPPELAAAAVDALYGKRAVSCSEGFWLYPHKVCRCSVCGFPVVMREAAAALKADLPVWVSHARVVLTVEDDEGNVSRRWVC